jgi:hypothetical protein
MLSVEERKLLMKEQSDKVPSIYGGITYDEMPYRWTEDPEVPSFIRPEMVDERPRILQDKEWVSVIKDFTLIGDHICDAYAALMPEHGFKTLVSMLADACDNGVENVENPPPELVALIEDMERIPDWIDMDLVKKGIPLSLNTMVHAGPYAMRGGFIGTFLNKYAALPLALTGSFSPESSGKRIRETADFFYWSAIPGAIERNGRAFKNAAMVRLMHSMVRFNVMRRGKWDTEVYGVPIPQTDQMPAGVGGDIFIYAQRLVRAGKTEFSPDWRARVEFARYRAFLLGLPEDLLPTTPAGIFSVVTTRHATLRGGWDDDTCGKLVTGTMDAEFEPVTWRTPIRTPLERSFSKFFFTRVYTGGDEKIAASMGVTLTRGDKVRAAITGVYLVARILPYAIAERIPATRALAHRRLAKKLEGIIKRYGGAEYHSDATNYKSHAGVHR